MLYVLRDAWVSSFGNFFVNERLLVNDHLLVNEHLVNEHLLVDEHLSERNPRK